MISLEINGLKYDHFTSIQVKRCYDAVPSDFSFTATTDPTDVTKFPILIGDICQVLVDDTTFITGFIDEITVTHSKSNHNINVKGSSIAVDLVESTMDASYEVVGPISLKSALESIVQKLELNVSVIDKTNVAIDDFETSERLSGDIGSSVWSLMVQAALKRNVLLTEDAFGNVIMTRGQGETLNYTLEKRVNGASNNILSSDITKSHSRRFSVYKVLSQPNGTDLSQLTFSDDPIENEKQTESGAESTDDMIRRSRKCSIMAEQASSTDQCLTRAIWQSNVSKTQSFSYRCTRQGFKTEDGTLIEPGHIVYVRDEYMSIASDLMIASVNLSYSLTGGSIATYECVLPDAFTLQANTPRFEKSGNDLEGIFDVAQDEEFN